MATLNEIWMPSPNYSTSRGPYNMAVHHLTVGATTIESLGGWFANPAAQCSSHHGADNYKRGTFGAYVYENYKAWTQGNANPYCLSIELCTPAGAENWSRDYWLSAQDTLLRNAAEWTSYICGKYGIPLIALNSSQSQDPASRGVTQHMWFGAWGSGHSDCGAGFPMDKVLEWAAGGAAAPAGPSPFAASVAFDGQGRPWQAGIWADGKVNVSVAGAAPYAVDPGQSGAKGGPGIGYDPVNDRMRVVFVNKDSDMASYTTSAAGPQDWGFVNHGGDWAGLCRWWRRAGTAAGTRRTRRA